MTTRPAGTCCARCSPPRGTRWSRPRTGARRWPSWTRQPADLVVSDIRMPDVDGVQLLERLREAAPDVPVILVTAFGDVEGAVEAIRRGAFDYLSKPYDVDAIRLLVRRALAQSALVSENRELRRQVRDKYRLEGIVGRSESMLQVFKTAARVAQSDATVLIEGESGTGKEQVARAIHAASRRAGRPVRGGGLRRHRRGRARVGAVRPRPRRLHRRPGQPARPLRGGQPRHPLPGRDRRRGPGPPGAAPARAAGGRDPPGGGQRARPGRRPRPGRHQQGPGARR